MPKQRSRRGRSRRKGGAAATNIEIADALETIADLLAIQGNNRFKVFAYQNAARTIRHYPVPMARLVAEEADLTALPSVGHDIAEHITEMTGTGRMTRLDELETEVPITLTELLDLQGVGPKKVRRLWQELDVETIDELEHCARAGAVAELRGFGERSQHQILDAIESYRKRRGRTKLADAEQIVEPLLEYMRTALEVERVEVAGSYRRRSETVGDLDLLVVAVEATPVIEHFTTYRQVREVRVAGPTRSAVVLSSGLAVDLRVVPPGSYGAALTYFTGSKAHNIEIRRRGQQRRLRISEYGVFRVTGDEPEDDPFAGTLIAGDTEESVYDAVGLPWIPPTLREDRGEVEAAEQGSLPSLVQARDIRGDLQMHSTWSDGIDSVEQMVQACADRGYAYMAITDHTAAALPMTRSLTGERIREQREEIERLRDQFPKLRLLHGAEVNVLDDGNLDLEDAALDELDLVIAAVHSRFALSRRRQTQRILKALQHPAVNVLAHPTCRLIQEREPIQLDLQEVFDCAAEHRVAIELNAQPDRLDPPDRLLTEARERGAIVVINTDAHRVDQLDLMRFGVDQAQRGWLEKRDVLNTMPLKRLLAFLRRA